jgi:hypothetical protein
METIIIRPKSVTKSKLVIDFLKKENIKAEIYKEPTKTAILKGIEKGAKETSLFLKGKTALKKANLLLSEL